MCSSLSKKAKDIKQSLFYLSYNAYYPSTFARVFILSKGKGKAMEDKRIGVVGIVVEDLESASTVNSILHEYANIIVGRMGIPYREKGISVISLIVDGTSDEISAMTGKLGKVKSVSVKSAMTKKLETK